MKQSKNNYQVETIDNMTLYKPNDSEDIIIENIPWITTEKINSKVSIL